MSNLKVELDDSLLICDICDKYGRYYIHVNDGKYLHKDGVVRNGVQYAGLYTGRYHTYKEAEEVLNTYLKKEWEEEINITLTKRELFHLVQLGGSIGGTTSMGRVMNKLHYKYQGEVGYNYKKHGLGESFYPSYSPNPED